MVFRFSRKTLLLSHRKFFLFIVGGARFFFFYFRTLSSLVPYFSLSLSLLLFIHSRGHSFTFVSTSFKKCVFFCVRIPLRFIHWEISSPNRNKNEESKKKKGRKMWLAAFRSFHIFFFCFFILILPSFSKTYTDGDAITPATTTKNLSVFVNVFRIIYKWINCANQMIWSDKITIFFFICKRSFFAHFFLSRKFFCETMCVFANRYAQHTLPHLMKYIIITSYWDHQRKGVSIKKEREIRRTYRDLPLLNVTLALKRVAKINFKSKEKRGKKGETKQHQQWFSDGNEMETSVKWTHSSFLFFFLFIFKWIN